jgi:hypothetical protein
MVVDMMRLMCGWMFGVKLVVAVCCLHDWSSESDDARRRCFAKTPEMPLAAIRPPSSLKQNTTKIVVLL